MEERKMIDNEQSTKPRIYVASLADYVAGRLIGRWIDAAQPAEAIRNEIAGILAQSREPIAEEWAIHDYEGFGATGVGEYECIDNVAEFANLIVEHGEVFAELVGHFGGASDLAEAKRYMEEGYCGEFRTITEYAEQFVEDYFSDVLAKLPEFLRYHIDYEGVGRDMELGGDIFTIRCGCTLHVFQANI
jgi:antirestriction protein